MAHSTSQACIAEFTPPTFAGIATLVAQQNGSLVASWLAGTDPNGPVRYQVYIQKDTATGLFSSANLAYETHKLTIALFQDGDGDFLEEGETYYVGVRATDALGNQDNNVVSLFAVSNGVLTGSVATIAQATLALAKALEGDLKVTIDDDEDDLEVALEDGDDLQVVLDDC